MIPASQAHALPMQSKLRLNIGRSSQHSAPSPPRGSAPAFSSPLRKLATSPLHTDSDDRTATASKPPVEVLDRLSRQNRAATYALPPRMPAAGMPSTALPVATPSAAGSNKSRVQIISAYLSPVAMHLSLAPEAAASHGMKSPGSGPRIRESSASSTDTSVLGARKSTHLLSHLVDVAAARRRQERVALEVATGRRPVPIKPRLLVSALAKMQMIFEYFVHGEGSKSLNNEDIIAPFDRLVEERILAKVAVGSGISESDAPKVAQIMCEVLEGYNSAVRKAVVSYVCASAEERQRLHLDAALLDVRSRWPDIDPALVGSVGSDELLHLLGLHLPWHNAGFDDRYISVPPPSIAYRDSLTYFPDSTALVEIGTMMNAGATVPSSLVFSVPMASCWTALRGEPLLPAFMFDRMTLTAPTVGNVARINRVLEVLLGRFSSLARHLMQSWHHLCSVGTLFVSVPTSYTAALGTFTDDADMPTRGSPAWQVMDIETFAAAQSGHAQRVRAALMSTWYKNAALAIDALARSYMSVLAASLQSDSVLPSRLSLLSSGWTELNVDLDAIADGDGPFAMPNSIRTQLDSDPKLRLQMKRTLYEYAEYLRRQKGLLQAAETVRAAAEDAQPPPKDEFSLFDQPQNQILYPMCAAQTKALSSVLGLAVPSNTTTQGYRSLWLQAHRLEVPAPLPSPGTPPSIAPAKNMPGPPSSPKDPFAVRPLSPFARLPKNSRFRVGSPPVSPGVRPEPPAQPAPIKGERPMLSTTRWRLEHDHHLRPLPRDLEMTSLEIAVEALPPTLPAVVNANLHVTSTALLAGQIRELTMRSLAAYIAFFLRFVPRRQRLVVDRLLYDYNSREITALEARNAATASAVAKRIAAIESRKSEDKRRGSRVRRQTSFSMASEGSDQPGSPTGSVQAFEREEDSLQLPSPHTIPKINRKILFPPDNAEKFTESHLTAGLGQYMTSLVRQAMGVEQEHVACVRSDSGIGQPLLGTVLNPIFTAKLEVNPAFISEFCRQSPFERQPADGPLPEAKEFSSPLVYAHQMRCLRAKLATADAEFLTPSEYFVWRAQQEGDRKIRRAVVAADATIPLQITPTTQQVQDAVAKTIHALVGASQDLPTLAFGRSSLWKKLHQDGTKSADASDTGASKPLHVPNPVAEGSDPSEMPSMSWMITGSSTATWAPQHQFLPSVSTEEGIVRYAVSLVNDIVKANLSDAMKLIDVFEPFSYLLLEPSRLDVLFGNSELHFREIESRFDRLHSDLRGGLSMLTTPRQGYVYQQSISPPSPLLSLEQCGTLLRQYTSSIHALERAVADVTLADILSHKDSAQAPSVASASRVMSRRQSEGYTTKELQSSMLVLPLSVCLDMFKLDCSGIIAHFMHLAHACASKVASYLDERCMRIYKTLTTSYSSMVQMVRARPVNPDELIQADTVFDRACAQVAPAMSNIIKIASEELNFLLRIDIPPVGGQQLDAPEPVANPDEDVVGTRHLDDSSTESLPMMLTDPTEPKAPVIPPELSQSDRIGGASVATLEAAVMAHQWERCIGDIFGKVSQMHLDVRNKLEASARQERAHAEDVLSQASASIDRVRSIADNNLVHQILHSTSLKSVAATIKPVIDELLPIVESLQLARHSLINVSRQEQTLGVFRSVQDSKAIATYLTRLGTGLIQLPWGTQIDLGGVNEHAIEVDLCFSAFEPVILLWTVARDVISRIDKWYTGPIFSLDRDEVATRVHEMGQALTKCESFFTNVVPDLVSFIKAAKRGDAPPEMITSFEADAIDEVDEGALQRRTLARRYGLHTDNLHDEPVLVSMVRALQARLSSFSSRGYPLIRIICNPNLSVLQWERINAIAGGKIGPPTAKQRGQAANRGDKSFSVPSSPVTDSSGFGRGDKADIRDNKGDMRRGSVDIFADEEEEEDTGRKRSPRRLSVQTTGTTAQSAFTAVDSESESTAAGVTGGVSGVAGAVFLAMLNSGTFGTPAQTAVGRGPSLQQLIDSYNIDDRLTDLQRLSDDADRAAGVTMP